MERYIITVTGKVQGVFFRSTAEDIATHLGLQGFARNEPDGSVYIEVEGDEPALKDFLAWAKQGPKHAKVERVDYTEKPPVGLKGFETR